MSLARWWSFATLLALGSVGARASAEQDDPYVGSGFGTPTSAADASEAEAVPATAPPPAPAQAGCSPCDPPPLSSDDGSEAPARARIADPIKAPPTAPPDLEVARDRLGPMVFPFTYGRFRLGGMAQLGGEMQSGDEGLEGTWGFRRLRIDMRFSFLDDKVSLRSHISLVPRDPELLDMHLDAQVHPVVHLRGGLTKTPFTAYRQQAINDMVLVDWPVASRWFGAERQLGFVADGKPGDFSYVAGVFGGDPSRPQNYKFSTAYGDPAPTRSSFRTATAYDVPHPELFARGGYDLGPLHLAASAAWDARPVHTVDTTARFALEGNLDVRRVELWGVGYAALSEDADGKVGEAMYGLLAESVFRVHERVDVSLRYSSVVLTERLLQDARLTADRRVAEASEGERGKLAERYADVARVDALQEATTGFAVYFFGHDLKLQGDVSWLRESRRDGDVDGFRTRTQLQLSL